MTKIADIMLPPPTVGKVTGGGSINVTNGIGAFGFIVQSQAADGSVKGDLQYVNHASGAKIHRTIAPAASTAATNRRAATGRSFIDSGWGKPKAAR